MQPQQRIERPNAANGKGVQLRSPNQTARSRRVSVTGVAIQPIIWLDKARISIKQPSHDFEIIIEGGSEEQTAPPGTDELNLYWKTIVHRLSVKYKSITSNELVLAGTPHIKGTRISVAHVLAELYHSGSIDAVAKKFSKITNKAKLKEALAYAHDFLESACDPFEDDD